jgi:hypothetical protein
MLNQISWADYISTIIAVTILYYLFVGGHFYGKDILLYVSARSAKSNSISFAAEQVQPSFIPDELKAYITEAGNADKDLIISGMNYILKRYDVDDITKSNINTYIKTNCSAHLSDQEMQGIWTR